MATEFVDFSAHYDTAHMYAKWTHPGGSISNASPAGRVGPKINLSFAQIAKTLKHKSTWIIGLARWVDNAFSFGDIYSGGHVDSFMVRLRLMGDGTISAFAGGGLSPSNLIFNSAPFSIHPRTWHYFEFKFTLSGTTNISITGTLRVDGTQRGTGTQNTGINVNTLLLQTATVNAHGYNGDATVSTWIGDLIINDGDNINANNPNNDFVGDITGLTVFPNGDVSSSWSATGSPQFSQINENPPDDDNSYIFDKTVGDLALFDWQDIPSFNGTIVTAHRCTLARKDAEGSKSFKHTIASTNSGDEFFVNDIYDYYTEPMDVDPATTNAWTRAGFNAKQFGNRIIS